MVAASKMKRAQERALAGKPYAEKISEMVSSLSHGVNPNLHPLLRREGGEKLLVILISTNKGLCGALNTELFRSLNALPNDEAIDAVALGKKGASHLGKTGKNLIADFSEEPFSKHMGGVTKLIIDGFLAKKYKKVFIIYNKFISALKQQPERELLLPLHLLEMETDSHADQNSNLLIEPSREAIFESLLPYFIEVKVRAALLQAEASEHSARMIAMKNATDNADDFISELTAEYNKARQQAITYEIADMVTARSAVEE